MQNTTKYKVIYDEKKTEKYVRNIKCTWLLVDTWHLTSVNRIKPIRSKATSLETHDDYSMVQQFVLHL